jgi:molecular chaperone DnaK
MAIIGIDLGTSNSSASYLRGGQAIIIPSAEGVSLSGKAFPSYVAITERGEMLVGEPARRQASKNPEGTARAFKRQMGKRDKITLRGKQFSPEQLSSFLLSKIKKDAEAFLGEPVESAVVTVPAYFDDNQRSATKDACKIANINVERLINEPTAASLAYGLDRLEQDLKIAVIDFGGGTLDVTIMEFGAGVFEVKATSGDTELGGTDMDQLLVEFVIERFKNTSDADISDDPSALARVRDAVEAAKIELSTSTTTAISLPFLSTVSGESKHLDMDIRRTDLERLVRQVVERCRPSIERALHDAKLTSDQVDKVILVGGPTHMPIVRQFIKDTFGKEAESGVEPMECVAQGAAIQAAVLSGKVSDIVLVDVTPLTLGIETLGGVATPLIARNSPIPIKHTEVFTTAADMQTAVTVHIFQGERTMAADNVSLGTFNLEGLAPAPRGLPKIEVTFDIDANGILNVTASDQATRKKQSIHITGSTRLSEAEQKRMESEAEAYAMADKERKEEADKLNDADAICYQAEKMLADFEHLLNSSSKERITELLSETVEAIKRKDAKVATQKAEVLSKTLQESGATIYSQTPSDIHKTSNASDARAPFDDNKPNSEPDIETEHGKVVEAEFHENK